MNGNYFVGFALQFITGQQFLQEPKERVSYLTGMKLDGYQKEVTPKGVLKLRSEEGLIYVKPPVRFFQGSHDPRFCWQGSGYTFSQVQIIG